MLVFRIILTKYATGLHASGRAVRWNYNDVKMIYTSGSQSLSCLENIVHRSKLGLSANFSVLSIAIADDIPISKIELNELPKNWSAFENMYLTQHIGNKWIEECATAVLSVPSSIVYEEYNYLINPNHPDFSRIKLVKTEPFLFDERIKS
ncbi:MAG: RES family NAD+ phosphorylase [Bacteroidota bacterium]